MPVIEMGENHVSSHSELLQVIPSPPVPCKPFEVLRIYELQHINFLVCSIFANVSALSTRSLSVHVFSPFDLVDGRISDLRLVLSNHLVEEDVSDSQFKSKCFVSFPLLELGFKNHASNAVKLLP